MITVRAGSAAIGICLLLLASACSREQQDWRAAESADTIEAYGRFIQRHPESELATQARTRVVQLGEDRDWQHAGSADTVNAYRQFLAEHPNGKWAQEARIRIENFSLGEQAGTDAAGKGGAGLSADRGASQAGATLRMTAAGAPALGLAAPGEAAVPATPVRAAAVPITPTGAAPVPATPAPATLAAATPPSPAAGSAARASGGGSGFGIQLGAFSTEIGANDEWRVLAGRFGPELQGLRQHVVAVNAASGRLYRLQATVGDEARARAICSVLRNRGQGCVAVLPN